MADLDVSDIFRNLVKARNFGIHPELTNKDVKDLDQSLLNNKTENDRIQDLKGLVSITITIDPKTGEIKSNSCSRLEMKSVGEAINQYAQTPGNMISFSISTACAEVLGQIARFTELHSDGTAEIKKGGALKKFLLEALKQAQSAHGLLPGMKEGVAINEKTKTNILELRLRDYAENGCSISESALQHIMFGPVKADPFPRPLKLKPDVEHVPIHWNPFKPDLIIRKIFNLDLHGKASTKVDKRKIESAVARGSALPRKKVKKTNKDANLC